MERVLWSKSLRVENTPEYRMGRVMRDRKSSQMRGIEPSMEIIPLLRTESRRFIRRTLGSVYSPRYLKLLGATAMLGTIDGLQAKYVIVGNMGEDVAVAYQVIFLFVAIGAAYLFLFDPSWSQARNLSNLLLAIPVATLADNISIDVQTLRPYFLLIPSNGYLWRIDVFGHTFFSPLAYWVNEQWITPGLINGYLAAIGIFVSYLALQFFWVRANVDSHLPSLKFHLPIDTRLRKRQLSKMLVNS